MPFEWFLPRFVLNPGNQHYPHPHPDPHPQLWRVYEVHHIVSLWLADDLMRDVPAITMRLHIGHQHPEVEPTFLLHTTNVNTELKKRRVNILRPPLPYNHAIWQKKRKFLHAYIHINSYIHQVMINTGLNKLYVRLYMFWPWRWC